MSSDSELEEFYDAEEATPKRYVQKNSLTDALEKFSECVTDSEESADEVDSGILNNLKSVDEEEKWMTVHSDKFKISESDELDGAAEKWTTIRNQPDKSDQSDDSDDKVVIPNRPERADSILEEEARLKEIRRIQEDRRKKEDAEFQNQLEELKRKKREKEMIEEKRRKENEKRRRKLEQMRRRVSDGSDHILVDSKEDSDSDVSQESAKDPVSIKLTVYTENINVSIPDINSANLVSNLCEAGRPTTLQANITIPDTKTSRSSSMRGDSNRQDRPLLHANLVVQEPLRSRSNSSINSSASEGPVVTSRRIPESDTIVNEVIVASNEPDIIRITKTRTPPSTLQYPSAPHNTLTFPVAPPRKKKCSSSELSDSPSEWSNRTSLTLPTPTSTVDKLTRDLEFTLDLQSALGGGRHIRTEDVDGHAINSDKPRFLKSEDRLKISSDSESSPNSNLQMYRPRSNSGHQVTDIQMIRPGSNSGRLLTDQVTNIQMYSPRSNSGRLFTDQVTNIQMYRPRSNSGRLFTDQVTNIQMFRPCSNSGRLLTDQVTDIQMFRPGSNSGRLLTDQVTNIQMFRPGSNSGRLLTDQVTNIWMFRPCSNSGRLLTDQVTNIQMFRPCSNSGRLFTDQVTNIQMFRPCSNSGHQVTDIQMFRPGSNSGRLLTDQVTNIQMYRPRSNSGCLLTDQVTNIQMYRPRSNSGRLLTDQEILDAVMVVNLDTGEEVPLSVAEDKIPKGMNPLSLHIMRLTKEYRDHAGDTESIDDDMHSETMSLSEEQGTKKKVSRLRKMLGKKIDRTTNRLKSVADQVLHMEETAVEQEIIFDGKMFKIKAKTSKMQHDFDKLQLLQDMTGVHTGAVWIMKFSPCGRLLATGGQDNTLRIWVLKSAFTYFNDMKQKYADVTISPAPSQESLNSFLSGSSGELLEQASGGHDPEDLIAPFMPKPFCTFRGHTADVLDVSWSKNHFILSSSMDKTVRLWHVSRKECLCTFQHIDFVTSIVFHPKDDRYFLSGSLDGKLRLWNIPDKKVTLWNEVQGPSALITTANFCRNGKLAVVGTYDGKCIFYTTEQLKYYTQIHVRSTRGKNAKGSKITGIEPLPGEDKVLVTSNDSRIRLYDLRDKMLTCKYKGCANNSSQIKASFSPKAKYIICGSEDQFVYIWKQNHDFYKFSSARRDRNDYWEAIKIHNAVVTAAIFAPKPSLLKPNSKKKSADDSDEDEGEVMVTADFTGALKVVRNLKGTLH
ncbi:WDR44 [Mytilus coruscus]|uniref:WD repeat-containing protein 44 n=1 Tax=Mytilus coruscus TaxID=42192 RepID=A0A6J8CSS0_MYTCO|nr:WDR44 [Mytilus coruscus]